MSNARSRARDLERAAATRRAAESTEQALEFADRANEALCDAADRLESGAVKVGQFCAELVRVRDLLTRAIERADDARRELKRNRVPR
jgi:hypothetical protein